MGNYVSRLCRAEREEDNDANYEVTDATSPDVQKPERKSQQDGKHESTVEETFGDTQEAITKIRTLLHQITENQKECQARMTAKALKQARRKKSRTNSSESSG